MGILQRVARMVEAVPDGPALVWFDGKLTYAEMWKQARGLACLLYERGVRAGDVIAVEGEQSAKYVLCLLAALWLGAIYLCLRSGDPLERRRRILHDSDARFLVLLDSQIGDSFKELSIVPICLGATGCNLDFSSAIGPDIHHGATPYICYTSGSTGAPKGVVCSQDSIINRFEWFKRAFPFSNGDISYWRAAPNVIMSGWEVFFPLMAGISVLVPRSEWLFDLAALVEHLGKFRVTHFSLVPSLASLFIDSDSTLLEGLTTVRVLEIGGEVSRSGLIRRISELMPAATIIHRYGSTELPAVMCNIIKPGTAVGEKVSIGYPIAGVTAAILNERFEIVPEGGPGILCLAGNGLAGGYLNASSLTAKKFLPCEFGVIPGERMYVTGDLARRLSSGDIEITGRSDFSVKIGGQRVEPLEVEIELLNVIGVKDAKVMGVVNSVNNHRLVAFVVLEAELYASYIHDAKKVFRDLRVHLCRCLAPYFVPAKFIIIDAMPLMANGKVDTMGLLKHCGDGSFVTHGVTNPVDWMFLVLKSQSGRFAIWPCDNGIPSGWIKAGHTGTLESCERYVAEMWDGLDVLKMRPG